MSWGLVLGGGGILGGAWTVGALTALERVHGLDARDASLIVGTSAGSVTAALLGAGVDVAELRAHQLGVVEQLDRLAAVEWDYDQATGGPHPPRPAFHPGSAGLVVHNAHRLRRLPPTAVLAALAPTGRGQLGAVTRLMEQIEPNGWSRHPGVRVVAMDFSSGRRVAFGAPGAPPARLSQAVTASCAIPGWYAPVTIGGRRYVDGGAASSTNVDLAVGHGLERVFVLAPTVSFAVDRPKDWLTRLERQWRQRVTRRCLREMAKVHAEGTEVTVVGPGPEDLRVIGSNVMALEARTLVLETAIDTVARALADPEVLESSDDPGYATLKTLKETG
jgi:NTE family protein